MKNQELFNKTISILVKAYQNNTLEHTNCYACAVQNIVAGNMDVNLISKPDAHELANLDHISIVWPNIDYYETITANLDRERNDCNPFLIEQLDSTGYTLEQLKDIESAFEGVYEYNHPNTDEWVFAGLLNVVDELMIIHQANEIEVKQAKELFVKA